MNKEDYPWQLGRFLPGDLNPQIVGKMVWLTGKPKATYAYDIMPDYVQGEEELSTDYECNLVYTQNDKRIKIVVGSPSVELLNYYAKYVVEIDRCMWELFDNESIVDLGIDAVGDRPKPEDTKCITGN